MNKTNLSLLSGKYKLSNQQTYNYKIIYHQECIREYPAKETHHL